MANVFPFGRPLQIWVTPQQPEDFSREWLAQTRGATDVQNPTGDLDAPTLVPSAADSDSRAAMGTEADSAAATERGATTEPAARGLGPANAGTGSAAAVADAVNVGSGIAHDAGAAASTTRLSSSEVPSSAGVAEQGTGAHDQAEATGIEMLPLPPAIARVHATLASSSDSFVVQHLAACIEVCMLVVRAVW